MDILVNIGHDDYFDNDIQKMGFVAAALEMELRAVLDANNIKYNKIDIELIGIIQDPHSKQTEVLNFTVGEGGAKCVIPSYMTHLGTADEV